MRYFDADEAQKLNAAQWQLELLALNPDYCSWGPHEDYMWKESDGWDGRIVVASWKEFGPWKLGDLNECVNFYFEINRASVECKHCAGRGTHPDAQWISESFYNHSSPFKPQTRRDLETKTLLERFGSTFTEPATGYDTYPEESVLARYGAEFRAFCERMRTRHSWDDDITADEAQALIAAGRAKTTETAESINARNARGSRGSGMHDAINRWILIGRRCERLGVPQSCPECKGDGHIFTEPDAYVSLVLWWLHPRKGCSRGIEITRIEQADLPATAQLLAEAAARNAERFSRVVALATAGA